MGACSEPLRTTQAQAMWDIDSIKEVLLDTLEVCSLRNGCGLTLKYWIWRDNEPTMWKIMVMAWKVSKYVSVGSYWVNEDVQSTVPFPASLAGLRVKLEPAHPWQVQACERIRAFVQQEQVGWFEQDYLVSFSSLRLLAPNLGGYRVEGPQTWTIKVEEETIHSVFWEQAAVCFGVIGSELCCVGRYGNDGWRTDLAHTVELFCLTDGTDVIPVTYPITWHGLYELISQLVGDGTLAFREDPDNQGWLVSPEILWKTTQGL